MNELAKIVKQSILSIVFTRDGRILIPLNKNRQYSNFPKYNIGIRSGNGVDLSKNEVGPFLLPGVKADIDYYYYKEQMTFEFGKRSKRYSSEALNDGGFISVPETLKDMGTLDEQLYDYNIKRIKDLSNSCYIRNGRNTYYLYTKKGTEIYENVECRYIVLPKRFDESKYRDCVVMSYADIEEMVYKDPDKCSMDLQIAIRQLNSDEINKFSSELTKQISPDPIGTNETVR